MFLIEKRNPRKSIAQEIWADELRAWLRRDMINAACDEYHGAVITKITAHDLPFPIHSKLEFQISSTNSGTMAFAADIEIHIGDDFYLSFKAENSGDPYQNECEFECFEFSFHDDLTATDHNNIKISKDALDKLNEMVSEEMSSTVLEFAEEEKFNYHGD